MPPKANEHSKQIKSSSLEVSLWNDLLDASRRVAVQEPELQPYLEHHILSRNTLEESLSSVLSEEMATGSMSLAYSKLYLQMYTETDAALMIAARDIQAVISNDPAVSDPLTVLLYLKGFHALQAYRLSNHLWLKKQYFLAKKLQSQASKVFGVDIHPACRIGHSVMLDHATGIVIGETAIVGNHVSILQGVTLGGRGTADTQYKRHPTVENRVFIGAGSTVLGNIVIGADSIVGANSVVLKSVDRDSTVVGTPARRVAKKTRAKTQECSTVVV